MSKYVAFATGGDTDQVFFEEKDLNSAVSFCAADRAWLKRAKPGDSRRIKGGGYFGDNDILIKLSGKHRESSRKG